MRLARAYGVAALLGGSLSFAQQVSISVEADQVRSKYHPIWNYFGADEPNYVYAPNGQKLLEELAALQSSRPKFPTYFRTHNLLTTGDGTPSLKWGSTNAYREDSAGRPIYDWAITDRIFDAFRRAGISPLLRWDLCRKPYRPIHNRTGTTFRKARSTRGGAILRAITPNGRSW